MTTATDTRNQRIVRTSALLTVLTKLDRILTGSPRLDIQIDDQNNATAPSWTDGNKIVFNPQVLPNRFDNSELVALFGLNYHELAHILYTPISTNAPIHKVLKKTVARRFPTGIALSLPHAAFNILEDQRIERLMVSQWPSTKPYFVHMVSEHIIAELGRTYSPKEALVNAYLLIVGRRYLGRDFIRESRKAYVDVKGADAADRLKAIVTDYQKVVFPKDTDRAAELICDLIEVVNQSALQQDNHNPSSKASQPVTSSQQKKNQEDAQSVASDADQEQDAQDQEADGQDGANDQGDQDQESDDATDGQGASGGGNQDDENDTGDSAGAGEPTDDDVSDTGSSGAGGSSDADSDSDSVGSGSAGVGKGDASAALKDLRSQARQIQKDVLTDELVDEELVDVRERMNRVRTFDVTKAGIPSVRGAKQLVTVQNVTESRKVEKEFRRLITQADPGWDTHHSDGRINIGRAMNSDDLEGVWDRWEPGHTDVNDLEVVILIDTSTSMRSHIDDVSRYTWALKRALDSIGASTTVLTYDWEVQVAYTANQTAERNLYRPLNAKGGTSITSALRTAQRILDISKRTHKIIITLTDGDWHDYVVAENLIQRFNKQGYHTALAYLTYVYDDSQRKRIEADKVYHHRCLTFGVVQNGKDLINFSAKVVKNVMKETIKGKRG